MRKFDSIIFIILFSSPLLILANTEIDSQIKKTHIEDIFIWKISDELRLSVQQEKQFSNIHKNLNKKKAELNRKIQDSIQLLNSKTGEKALSIHRKMLQEYSDIAIKEFDLIKELLGREKFISYLKIKNELTSKVKSILIGEKNSERREAEKKLPPPKVVVEKND